ncbi:hypothetical protein GCM10023261_06230 [Bartonella jaculi]|uniref:Transposase n=1 Tax=Bartonella jaculi TaxID=686226 RepID=A0ABP9N0N5_9HYPH
MPFAKDGYLYVYGVQQIVLIDDHIKIFAYYRENPRQEERFYLLLLLYVCSRCPNRIEAFTLSYSI